MIMVGGGGEKKTLRLVAKYADACNIFANNPDEVTAKLDVLRGHCAAEGRDYDTIVKTAVVTRPPSPTPTPGCATSRRTRGWASPRS